MSDATALLAAIRAAPDDDAPRLVYADWLDEHGQPERAEFIRVQCELARRKTRDLSRREVELLTAHHDTFAGHLASPGLRFRFLRGWVAGFGHSGVFHVLRGTIEILLRFFPRGRVICRAASLIDDDSLDDLTQWDSHTLTGQYELDSFESPARIQLLCASAETTDHLEIDGTFEGGILQPNDQSRAFGYAIRRQVVLYPIDGFDSFTET